MRSKPSTFRVPTALAEAAHTRWREAGYESMGEYLLGLLRYDLLIRRAHLTTANLARLSRAEQDKVDDEIAAMFAKGETLAGSMFEAMIDDAVKQAGIETAPEKNKVAEKILERLKKKEHASDTREKKVT